MPWARIGELVGHDDITTTSRVYTHVLADETEIDYAELLGGGASSSSPYVNPIGWPTERS